MRSEALEAIGAAGVLRIEFHWRGDRYAHVISFIDARGHSTPLLETIEGAPTDEWPHSPPLQSLSIETLADGRRAALLVGAAGTSHWSASVEASKSDAALHFDIACRHAATPDWLGNGYRSLSEMENASIRGEGATVTQKNADVIIQPAIVSRIAGTTRWRFTIQS